LVFLNKIPGGSENNQQNGTFAKQEEVPTCLQPGHRQQPPSASILKTIL